MKIRFNFPKIEIIHTYSNKESNTSILYDIYTGLKNFINTQPVTSFCIGYLLIALCFFIAAGVNRVENKIYSCTILNIKDISSKQSSIKTYEGYLQYNKYRFTKEIDENEYNYIQSKKLTKLDVNTNIYEITDELLIYKIYLRIAIIMVVIFISVWFAILMNMVD